MVLSILKRRIPNTDPWGILILILCGFKIDDVFSVGKVWYEPIKCNVGHTYGDNLTYI